MRTELAIASSPAIEKARSTFRADEESFGSILSDIARLLWPKKTAAFVAAVAGCSARNAEFMLAGKQKWSGDAIAALIAEIMRRHQTRNIRISAR